MNNTDEKTTDYDLQQVFEELRQTVVCLMSDTTVTLQELTEKGISISTRLMNLYGVNIDGTLPTAVLTDLPNAQELYDKTTEKYKEQYGEIRPNQIKAEIVLQLFKLSLAIQNINTEEE